eukprot:218153-Prymnesium_polylepis.1
MSGMAVLSVATCPAPAVRMLHHDLQVWRWSRPFTALAPFRPVSMTKCGAHPSVRTKCARRVLT